MTTPRPPLGGGADGPAPQVPIRLLQAASMTSAFDRLVVGPLLLSIAATFDATLVQAAAVASWYLLVYGLAQPLWGASCDRFGRVATIRGALGLAAVAGLVAAAAPTLEVLVVARAVGGGCIAAVIPAGLIYVGDVVPISRRQRSLSDLQSAQALGVTSATALGGLLAATASWRLALLLPAVVAGVLAVALRRLPEPDRPAGAVPRPWTALRHPWAVVVLVLAMVEGAALLGFLAYLAPALESSGYSPAVAGLVVATYGLGLLVASQVVKRLVGLVSASALIALGSVVLATAYVAVAVDQGPWGVGVAAALVGVSWAPLHSTMQAWATEVVPTARASMVSAYVTVLFVGSGLATWAVAGLAGAQRWTPLFAVAVALTVLCGVLATLARARADGLRGR